MLERIERKVYASRNGMFNHEFLNGVAQDSNTYRGEKQHHEELNSIEQWDVPVNQPSKLCPVKNI